MAITHQRTLVFRQGPEKLKRCRAVSIIALKNDAQPLAAAHVRVTQACGADVPGNGMTTG
ncbi:hypothetical protein ACX3YD_29355 [Pseudomonas fluorescens group sp. PF-1]